MRSSATWRISAAARRIFSACGTRSKRSRTCSSRPCAGITGCGTRCTTSGKAWSPRARKSAATSPRSGGYSECDFKAEGGRRKSKVAPAISYHPARAEEDYTSDFRVSTIDFRLKGDPMAKRRHIAMVVEKMEETAKFYQ